MTLIAPARLPRRNRCVGINATAVGLVLAVAGWSAMWAQALTQFHVLPPGGGAVLFFAGLGLGAVDQRRKARSTVPPSSNQEEGESHP
jgi:hypothetical protein